MLVPGLHRVALAEGKVLLTLDLGDAGELLRNMLVLPDAIYLDGFAPARNSGLWSPAEQ
jgi:tRNA 5-methylaminomethyl-2-thiouridine biosynthesis bifunctional protein